MFSSDFRGFKLAMTSFSVLMQRKSESTLILSNSNIQIEIKQLCANEIAILI